MKSRPVLFAALGAALLLEASPPPTLATTNLSPCCRAALSARPPTDQSLYLLDSEWASDVGRKVKLGVLRGRPQVLAMFFASCEFTCPVTVNDMKRIQEALPLELRDQVDFTLVTFDTERDTPKALHVYRERTRLGTDHWTLLTGKPDDVRELAALLGVNYQKDAKGQFAHSNLITVLNTEGEIIHRQVGLNQEPAETIKALAAAVAAKTKR